MKSKYQNYLDAQEYEGFVKATYETLLAGEKGEVHLRKHFEGQKSGHRHEIDVAIKTQVAGLDVLILVECKHYKKKVDVSDVLTLAARIDDIGAHKGVLVSTKGFQTGTIKVARAHGIGLVLTEPVWRTIMPNKDDKGTIDAFTTGGVYIGGESEDDLFLGTTVVATNLPARITPNNVDAWCEIIDCMSSSCDTEAEADYLKRYLEKQYSYVCPFCGERLRAPTSRQCESCHMDWYDLDHPVRREFEMGHNTSEKENYFDKLSELIARKFEIEPRWIRLNTNLATDFGANKIDLIELLLEVEEVFGFTFDNDFDENEAYQINIVYGYILTKIGGR